MSEILDAINALGEATQDITLAKELFESIRADNDASIIGARQDVDEAIEEVRQELEPTKTEVKAHTETLSTHGRRNLLINGKPQVWQSGETFTQTGYCADQWFANLSGAICTRDPNPEKGIMFAINQDQGFGQLHQLIESDVVKQLRDKQLTFSVEFAINNLFDGDMVLEVFYSNSGDSENEVTTSLLSKRFTPVKSSIAIESLTFTVPSDALGLRVAILPANGQPIGSQMGLYNAQLEVGSARTMFELTSYAEEFIKCCRFFYVSNNPHYTQIHSLSGTANCNSDVYYPVPMRALPSILPRFPAGSFSVAVWPNTNDTKEKFHMNSGVNASYILGYTADARL